MKQKSIMIAASALTTEKEHAMKIVSGSRICTATRLARLFVSLKITHRRWHIVGWSEYHEITGSDKRGLTAVSAAWRRA